jgi:hypothetical protein
MDEWRARFAANLKDRVENKAVGERLDAWLVGSHTSAALPAPVRRQWTENLKAHVIERLMAWFDEKGVAPPPDLVTRSSTRARSGDETERLRELVLECVRGMSRSELESVVLPPTILLRFRR